MAQQAPAAGGPRRERGGRQAGPDQAHGPATAWSYTGPARPGLEPDWSTAAPEWGTDPGWDASPEWGTDPGWSGPPAGQAPGHGGDQGSWNAEAWSTGTWTADPGAAGPGARPGAPPPPGVVRSLAPHGPSRRRAPREGRQRRGPPGRGRR